MKVFVITQGERHSSTIIVCVKYKKEEAISTVEKMVKNANNRCKRSCKAYGWEIEFLLEKVSDSCWSNKVDFIEIIETRLT